MPIVGTGLPFGTPILLAIKNDTFIEIEEGFYYKPPYCNAIVGKTEQYSILLYNYGTGPLVISSMNIIDSDGNQSTVFSLSKLNSKIPITIEPDSTYNLIIEFTPLDEEYHMSNLVLEHNGMKNPYYNSNNVVVRGEISIDGRGTKQALSTDEPTELPTSYSLSQNYPNPFNPTTKIEYSLPEASMVRLAIYNNLGQEVASLVNEYKTAGKHIADFNANNLPSGIYFYKIQAGNFNKTQKMVLMK